MEVCALQSNYYYCCFVTLLKDVLTIRIKCIKQYIPVVLPTLTFESVQWMKSSSKCDTYTILETSAVFFEILNFRKSKVGDIQDYMLIVITH